MSIFFFGTSLWNIVQFTITQLFEVPFSWIDSTVIAQRLSRAGLQRHHFTRLSRQRTSLRWMTVYGSGLDCREFWDQTRGSDKRRDLDDTAIHAVLTTRSMKLLVAYTAQDGAEPDRVSTRSTRTRILGWPQQGFHSWTITSLLLTSQKYLHNFGEL